MALCDWLLSFSVMFSQLVHVVACINTFFYLQFFYCWIIFIIWIYHIFFIYSSVDGYLGGLYFLAVMKNVAMNICIQVSVCTNIFDSLSHRPRSGTAESCGKSLFSILRNCHAVFQSTCTIFHSHQQCVRVPGSPHPRQHLLLSFLVTVVLVRD